jgi:hypothetical protein
LLSFIRVWCFAKKIINSETSEKLNIPDAGDTEAEGGVGGWEGDFEEDEEEESWEEGVVKEIVGELRGGAGEPRDGSFWGLRSWFE